MSDSATGRFVWYDLMTTDPTKAIEFYTNVVGWGTDTWKGSGGDMPPYQMWTNEGQSIGGVMELPEDARKAGSPPHWLAYIHSPDTDATVAKANELGGHTLVPPQDIPEVGRFAVLADPTGAAFCVYTSASEVPGHEGPANVGEMSWHELLTDDHEAAFDFYAKLFGWEKGEPMDMGEQGIYQIFTRGEMPLGGMMKRPAEMPVCAWNYYVRVDDLHAALERVKTNGGAVVYGPQEVPGGDLVAQCMDPQGAGFSLHQIAAQA